MTFIKCFDVVSIVVDEATRQFSPLWKVNDKYLSVLTEYCSAIDTLADAYNGTAFTVEVDDVEMTIAITLDCSKLSIKPNNIVSELCKRAIELHLSPSEQGDLEATFIFPSIWEKYNT